MINAVFRSRRGSITGFTLKGHAGDEVEGRNLVCAAVSSAAIMTVNTVTEIIGCGIECEEDDGYLDVELTEKNAEASDVLAGLRLHLEQLEGNYPEFVKVRS